MDLVRVETELKKRLDFPYTWGRLQGNEFDQKTRFIYKTYGFGSLLQRTNDLAEDVKNYALNRWYNYWSAMAVENIFQSCYKVVKEQDKYHKTIDFYIENTPFDHKTTIFPKNFKKDIEYAKQNKVELICWLYNNQSKEGRGHFENRLFIVLYDKNGNHWQVKSEIDLLNVKIKDYVRGYKKENLTPINVGEKTILSDIIWVEV